MTAEHILKAIRDAAAVNDGRPLGARAFVVATGITRTDLSKAGFARYSEAVAAAGLKPNKLQAALDSVSMLDSLGHLTRRLGRFPAISDIQTARRTNRSLPSYEAFFRLAGGAFSKLPTLLLDHCRARPEFGDVSELLESSGLAPVSNDGGTLVTARVRGYVYLAKHGRDYKIGRSNDVTRRRRELSLLLPRELEHVHVIETDDPEGIEQYWHRRFAAHQVRGEWYRLTSDEVTAFRRRRYQ